MVAALVRVQFDLDDSGAFANAPAERVIGNIGVREGRNVAQLGGPDIPAQCTAITMVLNNFDGYYTTGAGSDLGPGSRMRVQWRATSSDAWVTRFQGRLSELTLQFNGFSFFTTRWVGALYRFTSGTIPGRLIINQTPQSIMTVLADAAGVAAGERDFDTSTDEWNRQLSPGYQGVQEVQSMVDGFIYDAPDYKVRLELPAARAAAAVVARYTDGDPTAAELGVPPPRRLTRPFGIINHIDGEYHYYTPGSSANTTEAFTFDTVTLPVLRTSQVITITYELDGPPANAAVADYSITVIEINEKGELTIDFPATDGLGPVFDVTGATARFQINNMDVTLVGATICVSFNLRWNRLSGSYGGSIISKIDASVTLTGQLTNLDDLQRVFPRARTDMSSASLYGYRPRATPLVIGIFQETVLADDFIPDYADLDAAMQTDLDAYATPIPVFAIERACDTAAHRADILARRLSDKVHLTADGRSMLGFDGDCFVEAIQTTIRPTGELTQTLWIEEAPPPPPPPAPASAAHGV